MNTKVKYAAAVCLAILVLFGAAQVFLFTSNGHEKSDVNNEAYWLELAENAWAYYQPGKGLNTQMGLHSAGLGWHYFTDWDLGLYIQAIIDVEQLGILNRDGAWGADDRFDKILNFLETRELTSIGLPYILYDSENGAKYGDQQANACDTGKLLVALHNLKVHRPSLATRIDFIVYNRTNYEPFMNGWDTLVSRLSIYDYYVTRGYGFFWPANFTTVSETFLNSIASAPPLETYGVTVPKASLASEVLLHSIFELEPNSKVLNLTQQIYSAHEARYNATGKYGAFSEGNTDLSSPSYVYESVVSPDGRTWTIGDTEGNDVQISPIIYLKAAVGFQAIYNTEFTRNMVDYITSRIPNPAAGYVDGIDENNRVVSTTIDKTNGLVIGAARYAISNLPTPTPTPSPVLSQTPASSNPTPIATPTQANSPTPSTSPVATPSTSPIPTPSSTLNPTTSPTQGEGRQNETTIVVVIAAIGSSLLLTLLIVELRRKGLINPHSKQRIV